MKHKRTRTEAKIRDLEYKVRQYENALKLITETFIEKGGKIDVGDWADLVEKLQDIATDALYEAKSANDRS